MTFTSQNKNKIYIYIYDSAPGPVWTGAENLAPPRFDPLTVQPVASRYFEYAIPACDKNIARFKNVTN
jgi:hypothetical protein